MKENPGCTWNLFHHFHFHNRHHHVKRLLAEAKHAKGAKAWKNRASGRGTDTLTDEVQHPQVDEKKAKSSSVNSYSGRLIKILIAEEMSKEPDRGSNATSTSIQETHSDSVCDSELGESASLGELAIGIASSTSSLYLSQDMETHSGCETNSLPEHGGQNSLFDGPCIMNSDGYSSQNQLEELGKRLLEKHALLQEKLDESKEAILNCNFLNAKELARDMILHQSKDFLDALDVFNTDREPFVKILEDPNSVAARHTPEKQPCHEDMEVACSSLPTSNDSSPQKHVKDYKPKLKGKKWFTKLRKISLDNDSPLELQTTNSSKDAYRIEQRYDPLKSIIVPKLADGTLGCNTDLDPTLSSPSKSRSRPESGKVANRFRDLKQRFKQVIREGKKEQRHISMDGILHKVPYGSKGIRKEAVDQYRETATYRENGEQARNSVNNCASLSSSEKDDLNHIELSSSAAKSDIIYFPTPDTTLNEDEESTLTNFGAYKSSKEPVSLTEVASVDSRRKESCDEESKNIENVGTRIVEEAELNTLHDGNAEKIENSLLHSLENTDTQHGEFLSSTTAKTNQPSSDSVLDCCFQENISSRREDASSTTIFREQEVSIAHIAAPLPKTTSKFNEQTPIVPQEVICNDEVYQDVYSIRDIHTNQPSVENANSDDSYIHNDELEKKSDFTYVMDVLKASGLRGDESPAQWHSAEQPMNPLLLNEMECLPIEDTAGVDMVISYNHQLLFDCINEALLEMYQRSFKQYPWVPSLTASAPPMPTEKYILDEVWSEISWHLESQAQLDPSVEYLVSRDLAKSHGWTYFGAEAKSIVIELESLITNDLLDDALHQII